MKIPKLKVGYIVEIIWSDTHTPKMCNWMDEIEYKKFNDEGMKIKSVGIIKEIDDDFIRIVADTDVDNAANEKLFCRAINIGRGFIHKINILKRS